MTLDETLVRQLQELNESDFKDNIEKLSEHQRADLLSVELPHSKYKIIRDSGVSLDSINYLGFNFLNRWIYELDNVQPVELLDLTKEIWQPRNPYLQIIQMGISLGADPFAPDSRSGKSAVEWAFNGAGDLEFRLRTLGVRNNPSPVDNAVVAMSKKHSKDPDDRTRSLQNVESMFADGLDPNSIGELRGSYMHYATARFVTKFTRTLKPCYFIATYFDPFIELGLQYGGRLDLPVPKGGFTGLDKLRNDRWGKWPRKVRRKEQSPIEFIYDLFPPGQCPGPFQRFDTRTGS
jgi:hypothetical protein